ncbi:citrate synthase 2 [Bogoriella caseilytica]|nr:citrate synthase 2 [Bogoriella caseilytica]
MTDTAALRPGLAGVVAFETHIAEPDRAGGTLRYRGVDVEELVGVLNFDAVWGLLVDGDPNTRLPAAEPGAVLPATGDPRADLQAGLASLAPRLGMRPFVDIDAAQAREDLAQATATAHALAAQSARGLGAVVPQRVVEDGRSAAERFMIRWQGEPDPRHVQAVESYWITAAEHGMNASTFTARVIASTGADASAALSGAVGALSGPLHGGAPSRALSLIEEVERTGDAGAVVRGVLDAGQRLMGFGHAIYRAEDPRARLLRSAAERLGAPRFEAARALEVAALAELQARKPDRVLATNVEFWAAVVLDLARIPASLFTTLFACARMAGWSAHALEQKELGKIIRPSARYVGQREVALNALRAS